ncbi:DUF4411 family protein [Bdellovibrionota bacterium FG-1]
MSGSKTGKIFILDTSALIWAWKRAYPIDIYPAFWAQLDAAIETGTLLSIEPVLEELVGADDGLSAWAKDRVKLFLPMDKQLAAAMPVVMGKCSTLIDPTRKKDEADPYVVAAALSRGGAVVTQETPNGPKNSRMMIPDACQVLGLDCMNVLGLQRALGWVFRT